MSVFPTWVVWLSAALCCHGATLPGREKKTLPSLTTSSDTKVTLMRTVAPGGRLPTLMVNTSWWRHRETNEHKFLGFHNAKLNNMKAEMLAAQLDLLECVCFHVCLLKCRV